MLPHKKILHLVLSAEQSKKAVNIDFLNLIAAWRLFRTLPMEMEEHLQRFLPGISL